MSEHHFDRVTPQPDGTFKHSYRGEPVAPPGVAAETSAALVALADLEQAAKAGPASPTMVALLASKVRAALLQDGPATEAPLATVRVLSGVVTFQDVDLARLHGLDGRRVYVK